MEDLGDIEQTHDVAIVITDGLQSQELLSLPMTKIALTRCRKCRLTMSWRASVALVESRVTIGFLVMI